MVKQPFKARFYHYLGWVVDWVWVVAQYLPWVSVRVDRLGRWCDRKWFEAMYPGSSRR